MIHSKPYLFEVSNLLGRRLVDLEDVEAPADVGLLLLQSLHLGPDVGDVVQGLTRQDVARERTWEGRWKSGSLLVYFSMVK